MSNVAPSTLHRHDDACRVDFDAVPVSETRTVNGAQYAALAQQWRAEG